MKRRLTALLLVLICLPLTACQKQQNLYSATWFDLFDTVAIVQGYADSQDSWNAQTQAMYSDLQRYNELYDIYHHYDGVINLYDVNARAAAAPVQVSDELYAFLRWCKDTASPAANGATMNEVPSGRSRMPPSCLFAICSPFFQFLVSF